MRTKCKRCINQSTNTRFNCNYDCSRKGPEMIVHKVLTQLDIKKALENKLGIYISLSNTSTYCREILEVLKNV